MRFETEAQQACYRRIRPWMQELFGVLCVESADVPALDVLIGSARARTSVDPWGQDESIIHTRAVVVSGVSPTAELFEYLLRENSKLTFGAFAMDQDDRIILRHSIIGSTCDLAELEASVTGVVDTADRLDDEIAALWGGKRAID